MSLPMSMVPRKRPVAQRASSRPAAVPANESSRLSASSSRMSRARPDPSAARIAISRCRTVPRTSSRFATFMHAMSSTSVASPSIDPQMQRHQRRQEPHRDRPRQRLRDHARRDVLFLRIRALQPLRDHVHRRLRGRDADARPQPRQHREEAVGAIGEEPSRAVDAAPSAASRAERSLRSPRPGRGRGNPRGVTPITRVGTPSSRTIGADDRRIAAEPPLPELIGEHRRRSRRRRARLRPARTRGREAVRSCRPVKRFPVTAW